ncbi:MAG TPA: hypothetical protein VFO73_15985 [Candidatus Limnocylindrales bacterium]|nr:hypothetical protein [Candidatus Limnocylindrales bacterium]
MSNHRLLLAAVTIGLVTVACAGGAASPPASAGPTNSPVPSGIEHPTGSTDVVLRMEEGGGFVPIEFNAAQAPLFTLYGDGVVVFQPLLTEFPQPGADGITRNAAWRTAQLDAGQIEELLTFALGPGGLGAARDNYAADGIMDAPNTIFTIDGGGVKKVVTINALGFDAPNNPDGPDRASFKKLADRLRDFDNGGTISTDPYVPTSYRALIIEREPEALLAPVAWPWADIAPSDFSQPAADGSGAPFPHRTMTAAEVAALNLGDVPGGMQGLTLKGPDDKFYSFILRPLLPNEKD